MSLSARSILSATPLTICNLVHHHTVSQDSGTGVAISPHGRPAGHGRRLLRPVPGSPRPPGTMCGGGGLGQHAATPTDPRRGPNRMSPSQQSHRITQSHHITQSQHITRPRHWSHQPTPHHPATSRHTDGGWLAVSSESCAVI